jgi:hypothetical protein
MKSIGEQIMEYAQGRKTFTPDDVRASLPVNPKSISGAIGQLVYASDLIVIEKGVYRAANRNIERELTRLVLFGTAQSSANQQGVSHGR